MARGTQSAQGRSNTSGGLARRRPKAARRKPRKRAGTRTAVQAQLERYEKLFRQWLVDLAKAGRAVERYGKKVEYYRKRLDEMNEADRRATAEALAAAEANAAGLDDNRDRRQILFPAVNNNQTAGAP